MELQGTVKKIFEIQSFPSGFQKREMVILTQEQYPQPISIEFLSEKISLLDHISEGDQVKIGINIRGREWTNPEGQVKYFNSITGWRLEKISETSPEHVQATFAAPQAEANNENPFAEEDEDDLPF